MDSIHPPYLVMAGEHYNRIMRILEKGIPVEMEVETRINVHDDSPEDYNVLADLPGSDLADEIVMIGGHFDANSAGQGAIDNGAGSSVAMEAIRILKAIGVQPRRTIRAAHCGAVRNMDGTGRADTSGGISAIPTRKNTLHNTPNLQVFSTMTLSEEKYAVSGCRRTNRCGRSLKHG